MLAVQMSSIGQFPVHISPRVGICFVHVFKAYI